MTHFVRQQPALQLNNANAAEEYSARGVRAAVASALLSLGAGGMQQGTPWAFNQQASGASLGSALRYAQFDDATYATLNATGAFAGFDIQTSIASQLTDTFVPSCYNRGIHAEVWAMCGDSIMWSNVNTPPTVPITQQVWAQPVVGRNEPYLRVADGQWTNESAMVWSQRHWNRASRICFRLSLTGRYCYQPFGTTGTGSLSWDISPGWVQALTSAPQQTLGILLALGTNQYDSGDTGANTNTFPIFGSPVTGPPVGPLTTTVDAPSGTTLTFSATTGVAQGYLVTSPNANISQAAPDTPLAPNPAASTYVSAFTGTTVTLSQAVLGDVPSSTQVTFTPPNLIDNFAKPAVTRIRGFFSNRNKTKIIIAVPIARGATIPGSANAEFSAFGDWLNANMGSGAGQVDIDAVADTRLLFMFDCRNYVAVTANTTYYDVDKTHPTNLGSQILGGGLKIDGVTPGFSPGSYTYAIERAMGRV